MWRCSTVTKTWGLDHKKLLDTRYNLAVMYKERSFFKTAAQHLDLVIEGYTKLIGPEHWKTVNAVNQLETITKMMKDIVGNEDVEEESSKWEKSI